MKTRRSRGTILVLAVLLAAPALLDVPAPASASAGPTPTFDDAGVVRMKVRQSSEDFATAMVIAPDEATVMLAAGAGGDFGLTPLRGLLGRPDLGGPSDLVTTDFAGGADVAHAVAVTGSGGIVAAGTSNGDVAVARYDVSAVLDRSFDGDGRMTVDLGGSDDAAYAVVPLPDERLVVVGGRAHAVTVLRLLPGGGPDPTFGAGGRVTLPSSGPGRAAALQPDGKLLVAGGGDNLVAYRLLPGGGLDAAFGQGGVATIAVGGPARANAMVLGPDGSVTLAGTRGADVVVARLTPAGTRDLTFGGQGVAITPVDGGGSAHALARHADGALLAAGEAGGGWGLLVRYRPDGSLETGFGAGGVSVAGPDPQSHIVPTRFRAVVANPAGGWLVAGTDRSNAYVGIVAEPTGRTFNGAVDFGYTAWQLVTAGVVQADGKVVAVAPDRRGTAIGRFNADGSPDRAFGVDGVVVTDRIGNPRAVAMQAGGRILVGGSTISPASGASIAGFRPDGSLDTAFGDDGRTPPAGGSLMHSLAVLPDDSIVLAGNHESEGMLFRFTPSGAPDRTLGQGGRVLEAVSGGSPMDLTVQADGRLLLLATPKSPPHLDVAVYRLDAGGTPDPSFGTDGRVQFESSVLRQAQDLAVQSDGRILVTGTRSIAGGDSITVVRLRSDGSLDPTWSAVPAWFGVLHPGWTGTSRPSALAVQSDGKVVVAGTAFARVVLLRLHPDGTHDRTFGIDGLMDLPLQPQLPPVLVAPDQPAGLLVVAADDSTPYPRQGFMVARVAVGRLGAPLAVTAVAGSGSARVRWTLPPAFDESPALAYRVRASDGVHTALTPDGRRTSVVVGGLVPGQTYTFTVEAVRGAGAGPISTPSNPVTANLSEPTSAWGWNGPSSLGDGTTLDRLRPLTGAGAPGAVALAAGALHSLSLRADGTVWSWGWNDHGQLGDGSRTNRSTPVQVAGLTNVAVVAAGAYHSLALKHDGTVWAWGWNGVGQIGNGSNVDAALPVQVAGLSGITAIAAGFHHNLAVRPDGTVAAWGWNVSGQLGDGSTTDRWRPQAVPGLTGVTAVAGGAIHSLALANDGRLWAWGLNNVAQLGTMDLVDRHAPALVLSVDGIVAIAAGAFHNYALDRAGHVRSWGWNAFGQLGNPTTSWPSGNLEVWELDDVASIASGWYHGLALKHDGTVVTWGWNVLGQLGDGTTVDRYSPRPVDVPPAVAIAGGALHSLAA